MAFAIREHGSRAKLPEVIKSLKEMGADGQPVKDQSFIEAAKTVAADRIAALPAELNHVTVIMEGRDRAAEGTASFQITVQVIGAKAHL